MGVVVAHAVRPIVLTGGIGSGKSRVASVFHEWGAYVVDADQLARDVVEPGTKGRAAVENLLGPKVVAADGSLDRAAMADLVFTDPALLAELEGIIHPLVHEAGQRRFAHAPVGSVRVYEVPLPGRSPFDETPLVVVVDAPDDVRRQRLLGRGLSADQIAARMSSQPSRAEWLALADEVIDNSGSEAELLALAGTLWRQITGQDPPVGPES